MDMLGTEEIQKAKPKFYIWFAYILLLGSAAGILAFAFKNYLIETSFVKNLHVYFRVSPVVFFYVLVILSAMAIATAIGILLKQKFGWILAQVFFIFLMVRSIYGLYLTPLFIRSEYSLPLSFHLLKFFLRAILAGVLFYYFNKKCVISSFSIERDEANRIYLISFVTFTLLIFLKFWM